MERRNKTQRQSNFQDIFSLVCKCNCRSRFGLYLVDFQSPNKTRTPKHSAKLYSSVVSTRGLPADYNPEDFTAFSGASKLVPTLLPLMILYRPL